MTAHQQAGQAKKSLCALTARDRQIVLEYLGVLRQSRLESLAIADENVQLFKAQGRVAELTELLRDLSQP